jgi:hypothetical protein
MRLLRGRHKLGPLIRAQRAGFGDGDMPCLWDGRSNKRQIPSGFGLPNYIHSV